MMYNIQQTKTLDVDRNLRYGQANNKDNGNCSENHNNDNERYYKSKTEATTHL